jgi:transposase
MSLRPEPIGPVPEETARVARAAFPKGHPCLRLRDELGPVYDDARFAALFPAYGRPAEAPWRLALVTVLQFADGLTDRQAADAVRDRLAWKYLLGLELTDTGFDFSVLSDFRARLVAGAAEQLLLEALLDRCKAAGLVKPRGQQRTDSTHVLAAVRALNRLDLVGETLRHALDTLAAVAPDWLRAWAPPAWYDRYGTRIETTRRPLTQAERDGLAATIGADGRQLLSAVYGPGAPDWLREIPAVQTLRQVWLQHSYAPDAATGSLRLRAAPDLPPPARTSESPYDRDARFHTKRRTSWVGYPVHLTETCDPGRPHLVTQVATVPASTNDVELTDPIQADLAARGLLPGEHLLDSGYVDAQHLCGSAKRGIELVGPALLDTSWQAAAAEGCDVTRFALDWERRTGTCPGGTTSRSWTGATRDDYPFHQVKFAKADCLACPLRAQCTRSASRPRQLSLRPREEHVALQLARRRQATDDFAARYRKRAGVEGTIAQGVQACGRCGWSMWRSRSASACSGSTIGGPRPRGPPPAPPASLPSPPPDRLTDFPNSILTERPLGSTWRTAGSIAPSSTPTASLHANRAVVAMRVTPEGHMATTARVSAASRPRRDTCPGSIGTLYPRRRDAARPMLLVRPGQVGKLLTPGRVAAQERRVVS